MTGDNLSGNESGEELSSMTASQKRSKKIKQLYRQMGNPHVESLPMTELEGLTDHEIIEIQNRLGKSDQSREALNRRLSYESLVRWPKNQSAADLPLNYHRNCIDLDDYLKAAFFEDSGDTNSRQRFLAGLQDYDLFEPWILESHRIMVVGTSGSSWYAGQSKVLIEHGKEAGKLRQDAVHLKFATPALSNLFTIAHLYKDRFALDYADFRSWNQHRLSRGFKLLFPLPGITYAGDFEEVIETFASTRPNQAGQQQYTVTPPDISLPVMYCPQGADEVLYFYPGKRFIPDYLALMQEHLRAVFVNAMSGSLDAAVVSIAHYYQCGIRSQAVKGIWNSVLMGHVNALLEMLGLSRLHHMNLDFAAFCLSAETYCRLFSDLVFGRLNITDPAPS